MDVVNKMGTMLYDSWECINGCVRFEVVGNPQYCPYCGVNEVYPVDDEVVLYQTTEENYVND